MQEYGDISHQIQCLYGESFIFKLKLTDFNLKQRLKNYTRAKVFAINEKLKDEFNFQSIQQVTLLNKYFLETDFNKAH